MKGSNHVNTCVNLSSTAHVLRLVMVINASHLTSDVIRLWSESQRKSFEFQFARSTWLLQKSFLPKYEPTLLGIFAWNLCFLTHFPQTYELKKLFSMGSSPSLIKEVDLLLKIFFSNPYLNFKLRVNNLSLCRPNEKIKRCELRFHESFVIPISLLWRKKFHMLVLICYW